MRRVCITKNVYIKFQTEMHASVIVWFRNCNIAVHGLFAGLYISIVTVCNVIKLVNPFKESYASVFMKWLISNIFLDGEQLINSRNDSPIFLSVWIYLIV